MFWRYLKLILSSWVLQVIALLDVAGFITTYFDKLKIPYSVYLCLLIIGLILSGYNIYKKSAPKILIEKPSQEDVSFSFPTVDNNFFRINMKSYLTNYALQSGSLEYIKLKFVNVNDLEDEFLIEELGIRGTEGELSKKKSFPTFSVVDNERTFQFPMIVAPDTVLDFYLRIDISLSSYDKEEISRKVNWLKYAKLELEYKIKDSFGTETINIPFKIELGTLSEVLDRSRSSNQSLSEIFGNE
ncbi:hypothetical protein [Priestia megaterium]|uniref:hypothetical protein n=1 Tax=Priestia megaterium TaxID=1404 RepID=UPI001FB1F679|nr:hypothetical protein [Priestia megaterium]